MVSESGILTNDFLIKTKILFAVTIHVLIFHLFFFFHPKEVKKKNDKSMKKYKTDKDDFPRYDRFVIY